MKTIGIDLGTTNSSVASMRNGIPEALANEMGEHLTPSAVAIASDGEVIVGRAARDRLVVSPESGRAFFKREMGTKSFYKFGGRKWTPTECSALIISEMKRIARLHLGQEPKAAVITVPAYFRESQRQATVEAAKIAGIAVARILNEPTAAALAYGYRDPDKEARIFVFDIGGGTFDVTLLDLFSGVVEVTASGGESRLGGEDYTDVLLDALLTKCELNRKHPSIGKMRQQAEVVKRHLSNSDRCAVTLEGHEMVVSRGDLARAGRHLTARLRPVLLRCLRDAGADPDTLDDVLLVGGASRMHVVKELVLRELGCQGNDLLDPDRVVTLGAAVQAALCDADSAVDDIVLTDVCAHTLGISTAKELAPGQYKYGYFEPLVDRNTTVPVSRSKLFNTLNPTQDEIVIEVYQGEGRMVKDNQLLGKLKIHGLRHRPGLEDAGAVDVRFSYDMNGLLEVEGTVVHSGKQFSTIIEGRPGALTPKQIRAAMQRLAPLKIRPGNLIQNRARLERAYRLYEDLKGEARDLLGQLLDSFEAALETQEEAAWAPSGEMLDSFLAHYYVEEGESRPLSRGADDPPGQRGTDGLPPQLPGQFGSSGPDGDSGPPDSPEPAR